MKRLWWLWLVAFPFACRKKDNPIPRQAPLARFFLDSIGLEQEDRLPSRFSLSWSGDDPDGYVVGYELRINGGPWSFTTAQESTFVVSFEPGTQYKDVIFELRAVDNDGLRTEPPARLRVPLRNSPPTCRIDASIAPPDTALIAITLSIVIDDPDGRESVDSVYIRIGSAGSWTPFSPRHTLLTLVPQNPSALSPTLVYVGSSLNPAFTIPTALPLDDTLRLYVRAKDQGGLFSEIDSTNTIFLRRKNSDWLVMDSWTDNTAIDTMDGLFRQAWGGYDYWNLRRATQRPPLRLPTWLHILRAYPRVYWIGSQPSTEEFEVSETLIEQYLSGGGRLFVNLPLRHDLGESSPIFRWSPADSISKVQQNGLLASGSSVSSTQTGFPNLTNGLPFFMSSINPPYPKGTATIIYEMPNLFQGNGQPWPSSLSRAAAVGFPIGGGKFRQILCILPVHQLGGDRIAFLTALQNALQP
ncbi:MAG: hypothetical protein NZZ60_01945 [Bacteroidia bacterium]|nr:hypothetical protein [Bacteroidia bacterium]MCX7652931.1 hypothetical protein [Bacteroidia bacterium]MDW8416601.1 hypothetical protein [Bacteroidia bacterium]